MMGLATAMPRKAESFPLGLSPKPIAHRYEALDSLRGICALLVCLFHFKASGPIAALPFVRGSWLFVDFFFVLSGFVIAANYRERLIAGGFLRGFVILRFGRVYPLHLFMLLAFVAVELVGVVMASKDVMQRPMFDDRHSVAAIFTNLSFTQSFGLHDGLTWNQPAWSIAVEFWTYLLFALVARRAGAALETWLGAAIIISIGMLLWVSPDGINVTYSWSLLRCIYGFAVGAIAWRLWQRSGHEPIQPYRGATLAELATVAAVIAFVSLAATPPFNLAAPLLFGSAVLVFARGGGMISRVLLVRPLRILGVLSFSIYMVHAFVQARFDNVLGFIGQVARVDLLVSTTGAGGKVVTMVGATPAQGVVFTLVMLAVVVGVSHCTWQLVEIPGQRWARQLATRG
jgi:peptidoglycan/LPS O-acetylase OafA/YrhL